MPSTRNPDEIRRDISVLQDARLTAIAMRLPRQVEAVEQKIAAKRAELRAAQTAADFAEFSQLPEHLYPQAEG